MPFHPLWLGVLNHRAFTITIIMPAALLLQILACERRKALMPVIWILEIMAVLLLIIQGPCQEQNQISIWRRPQAQASYPVITVSIIVEEKTLFFMKIIKCCILEWYQIKNWDNLKIFSGLFFHKKFTLL